MLDIVKIGSFVFELGLFGLLIFTLIYARRLDRSIIQMRTDRMALKDLLDQIGASITAALNATDRLKAEAGQSITALDEACQAAAVSTRKLDELISNATLAANSARATAAETTRPKTQIGEISQGVPCSKVSVLPVVTENKAEPLSRPAATRRVQKTLSRAERDLTRMLRDAS